MCELLRVRVSARLDSMSTPSWLMDLLVTEAASSLEALPDGGAAATIFASWKADAALSSEAVATVAAMVGEPQWSSACADDLSARDAVTPAVAAYVAYVVMPCPAERLVTYVA